MKKHEAATGKKTQIRQLFSCPQPKKAQNSYLASWNGLLQHKYDPADNQTRNIFIRKQKKKKTWKSSATNRKNLGNRQVWVEILAWKWWTSTMWEPCASLEWSKLGTPILTHCCDSWRRYPPWPVLLLACTKLRVRKWARNGPSLLWLSH